MILYVAHSVPLYLHAPILLSRELWCRSLGCRVVEVTWPEGMGLYAESWSPLDSFHDFFRNIGALLDDYAK